MYDTINIFQTVPKIIFGANSVEKHLGQEIKKRNCGKVLLITDKGIVNAGIDRVVLDAIESQGMDFEVFDEVEPDPKIEIVKKCSDFIKEKPVDFIIGLGGGSSLDIAKAVAIMQTNEGPVESYAGMNLVPKPGLPFALIPTTAGTGSEVTSISVLSDTKNDVKVGVVSDYMFADFVLLDPHLTLNLPKHITASTGLDALIHAIESYTGKRSSFITEPLAHRAIEYIARYLRRAYADGSDLEARKGMLQASLLAGLAFSNTQTAGVHACALSLGAMYHLPHGVATSLLLPAVMRHNLIAVPEKYIEIARLFGEELSGLSRAEAARKAIDAVEQLISDVGFKLGLDNYGVKKEDIDKLAAGAMKAKRLWENNPRVVDLEECKYLFECSFNQ